MNKLITRVAGAVGVTAVSIVMFATGVAAADDYAGQTYADATKALSDAKLKGVIASRFKYKPDMCRAMCTIAGGEKLDDIDEIAPVVPTNKTTLRTPAAGDAGGGAAAEPPKPPAGAGSPPPSPTFLACHGGNGGPRVGNGARSRPCPAALHLRPRRSVGLSLRTGGQGR